MSADPWAWVDAAECVGLTDLFFPERGQDATAAKAICQTCPSIEPCLHYALVNNIEEGIWGGASERRRRILRRQLRIDLAVARGPIPTHLRAVR